MEHKILLFKPDNKRQLSKSPLYAASIFLKILALSSKYLVNSFRKDMSKEETDGYLDIFWRMHFEESSTKLYTTGQELLAPDETYLFMSNHESWMDIPAIFGAVPHSLRMVAKAGIMKIPVFGHAMTQAGFIAVDRKNRTKAIRQLDEAKARLREGISVWISPEGTRTRTGEIGHFKKGGFYLAKDLNLSIVPVFIEGAASVMPADSLMIKTGQEITVHFCKPVSALEISEMTMLELIDRVRLAIVDKQRECRLLTKGA